MCRILDGQYGQQSVAWFRLSKDAADLIRLLLVVEEPCRLSCADALRHTWVEPGAHRRQSLPQVLYGCPRQCLSDAALRADRLTSYSPHAPELLKLVGRFARLDTLQQLVLTACAQVIPELELISCSAPVPWYDLFFALDANDDGRLDFPELLAGLRLLLSPACGPSDEQLGAALRALDVDRSGAIDWSEWAAMALLSFRGLAEQEEPLCTAFRLLDRPSGDGLLGAVDLLALLDSEATGVGLPCTCGRERAHEILQLWAPPRQAAPALQPEDLRLALEAALVHEDEDLQWEYSTGWCLFCRTPPATLQEESPVLVQQLRGSDAVVSLRDATRAGGQVKMQLARG